MLFKTNSEYCSHLKEVITYFDIIVSVFQTLLQVARAMHGTWLCRIWLAKKIAPTCRCMYIQVNTLNSLVRLSYTKHGHFKIFIIKFNRLIVLWNENQFLISYPGTEQYNLLILNSARVASYHKVTSSLPTLELIRYRLPSQQTSTTQIHGHGSSTISTPSWRFP